MPKIILPNAYFLYHDQNAPLETAALHAAQLYALRFMWLMEAGDILILPQKPECQFVNYVLSFKKQSAKAVTIFSWHDFSSSFTKALLDNRLLELIKQKINLVKRWTILSCYFNKTIMQFMQTLQMPISADKMAFLQKRDTRTLDSKVWFRKLAKNCNVDIAKGTTVASSQSLYQALQTYLPYTSQLIVKQDHGASGKGNIGISKADAIFSGVQQQYTQKTKTLAGIAESIWHHYTNTQNKQLVVEVYYPNKGSFSVLFWIDVVKPPVLLNYNEIRMEKRWIGVEMPAQHLKPSSLAALLQGATKLAQAIQQTGYTGYFCCDAIETLASEILFTEINVRPAAEIPAHLLLSAHFGPYYFNNKVALTRREIKMNSFLHAYETMHRHELLLRCEGVVIMTIDHPNKTLECLIVGDNLINAQRYERKLLKSLRLT